MVIEARPGWYVPADGYLWDPWFQPAGETVHLFHLFQPVPGDSSRDSAFARDRPTIAHATWSMNEGWTPRGTAIGYTQQAYDERRIHTGCVVEHEGSFSMLYSGANRFVCLAESGDLDSWTKAPQNPVAYPDPAIYMDRWRDPWVLNGSVAEKYTMLVAAQQDRGAGNAVGVVAVAHSADLEHWQQDVPLQTPDWFEWLEVPELHHIDGTWYLLFATRQRWITAAGEDALEAHGLRAVDGAYYLMASSWRGPYEAIGFLSDDIPFAYTTRMLRRSETEYWLWSHVEKDGDGRIVFGLQPPRVCTAAPGGGLLIR